MKLLVARFSVLVARFSELGRPRSITAYFPCLVLHLLLAASGMHCAYVVVDKVNCVNVLDLLNIQSSVGSSFTLSGVPLQYNRTPIPVTDHALFDVSPPQFSFSPDVHKSPEENTANQRNTVLLRKHQLEAAKFFPSTRIVLLMLTPIKFHPSSSSASQLMYNTPLKQSVETMLRNSDLDAALVKNTAMTTASYEYMTWRMYMCGGHIDIDIDIDIHVNTHTT